MKGLRLKGKIKAPIRRIVSLAPALTETLFFLGLGPRVVGVTEQCDYPEEAKGREKVGGFAQPDVEKICQLRPDLVLVPGQIHEPLAAELRRRSLTVALSDWKTVAEILQGMKAIAELTEERQGHRLVESLRERVKRVRARVKGLPPPRVFRLMSREPIVTPTELSFQYDVIRLAGGKPFPIDAGVPFAIVPLDRVLEFDPEVIISCGRRRGEKPRKRCSGCRSEQPPCLRIVEEVGEWEGWKETSAASTGRIYPISCDIICRPGPRLIEGLEMISQCLHPEAADWESRRSWIS